MRILFTGGGTGGHIMPIISVARELNKLSSKIELHYIGPKSSFKLTGQENFKNHSIAAGKMRRYFAWQNFIDLPFKIPFSFLQSFFALLLIRPKLVFSKGGTGSLPVTYCARILRIPVFMHESDVAPGLSNKITSRWAKKIFVAFEKTEYFDQSKTFVVGNPIRKELLGGDKEEAIKFFNLTSQKPIILISGGSSGATAINEFILVVLNKLLQNYEVIHVSGPSNYKAVNIESKAILSNKPLEKYYHLYEFLNQVQLKNAYTIADIVVSRAGASNIFEIAAVGKPAILIPLPSSASNHQLKNAYQYAKSGAAIVIEQESLSLNYFLEKIDSVISKSEKMKEAALGFAKPDAAEKIASEILNFKF